MADGAERQVILSWKNPTDFSFTLVRVYRDGMLIYEGTAQAFSDLGATAGKTYTYSILPVFLDGRSASRITDTATLGEKTLAQALAAQGLTTLPIGGGQAASTPSATPSITPLTKNLTPGMTDPEVTMLQRILTTLGLLTTADQTGTFDPKTVLAVQIFQKTQGIVTSGTPATTGYGAVGPTTRTKLNAKIPTTAPAPTTPTTGGITLPRSLYRGLKGTDVILLQNYLISKKYLAAGNNSGFFGAMTEAAVKALQKAWSLEPAGIVGPKTREFLRVGR